MWLRFKTWFSCRFGGHPCTPTGRRGVTLREWKCQRCGGIYVSHTAYGNTLIPADSASDIIFTRWETSKDALSEEVSE